MAVPDWPPLAIVIVTYSSGEVVEGCLRSLDAALAGAGPARVVVVDNASADDTVERVREVAPEAEVIQTGRNAGFAAGVNAGIAAADGCDVLVLNPDIRLAPGSVLLLRQALALPGTGIAAPRLTGETGKLHLSLRRRPTVPRAFGEALLGGHRAGRIPALGELVVDPAAYGRPQTADWVSGAAWMVSRACLDALDPLDERYFLYSEETEYMLRAGEAGFAVRYEPRAVAVHLGGEQSTSSRLWALSSANRVRMHRERYGCPRGQLMRLAVGLNELVRAVAKGGAGGRRHRAALRQLVPLREWPLLPDEEGASPTTRPTTASPVHGIPAPEAGSPAREAASPIGEAASLAREAGSPARETVSPVRRMADPAHATASLAREGSSPAEERASPGYVCFSAQDWWYHNRAHSDFQLMRSVAAHRKVLVVNSIGMRMPMPGRSTQVLRRVGRKLRSVAMLVRRPLRELPGFYVMSPLPLPFYGSPLARRVNALLVRAQVLAVSRALGLHRPVIMVTIPTAWDVVRPMRRRALVFNRSDRHSSFPESDRPTIEALERGLLESSDHVVYVSTALMGEESGMTGDRAHFLDHGVDTDHFRRRPESEQPADLRAIPGPRVGFFGALDDYLVDFDLLERIAVELPDVSLVLIGDATVPMERLTRHPNVHWLGFRPYERIPAYGSGFDVAIMPWLDNPWIRNSNPIKLKEYLALGLPVVSTDFQELVNYADRVRIAADGDLFIDAVRATLRDGGLQPADTMRGSVLGASWSSRAAQLMALAELSPGPR
ncbi:MULTISPECIES: glycosyltransferase [unclassified Streptosporangium]|uniref:glycosyltransferase n=1 Tax=unclassified Streptosporangium TaxID=2632669 RepID=UPI002E2D60F3|nr:MULTISPECIES: glycosyltransferase [unclassified Streptosporangium]